jgi:hypothetical protein
LPIKSFAPFVVGRAVRREVVIAKVKLEAKAKKAGLTFQELILKLMHY